MIALQKPVRPVTGGEPAGAPFFIYVFLNKVVKIYKDKEGSIPVDTNDLKPYLAVALKQSDAHYKALANFMFREIIEDAHTKYNISDEDMEAMCKKAVNRAMVYVNSQKSRDKAKRDAFLIYALYGLEWDDAETTDDVIKQYELLKGCEEILRDVQ